MSEAEIEAEFNKYDKTFSKPKKKRDLGIAYVFRQPTGNID